MTSLDFFKPQYGISSAQSPKVDFDAKKQPMRANVGNDSKEETKEKWYGTIVSLRPGFGYIQEDPSIDYRPSKELFFKSPKSVNLKVGDRVSFNKAPDQKKIGEVVAVNVTPLSSSDIVLDPTNLSSIMKWLESMESNLSSGNSLAFLLQRKNLEMLLNSKLDMGYKVSSKLVGVLTHAEFLKCDRDRTETIYRSLLDSNYIRNPNNLLSYFLKMNNKNTDDEVLQVLVLVDNLLDRYPQEYDKLPIEALEQALRSNHRHRTHVTAFFENVSQKRAIARKNVTKNVVSNSNLKTADEVTDFREVTIFPNSKEILSDPGPLVNRMRKNVVEGKYDNILHYLDVHFRLLREDCVSSIRDGIISFRQDPNFTSLDVFVYRNVKVIGVQCANEGIVYRVSFDVDQEVNWACSSRLLYGSLICLSPDDFETLYWASVSVRDPDLLAKKRQIDIRFPEGFNAIVADVNSGVTYRMVESISTYFEAYKHVLMALQNVELNAFPFVRHLVKLETQIKPPSYLTSSNQTFKFDNILENSPREGFRLLNKWPAIETGVPLPNDAGERIVTSPTAITTVMDHSQLEAFKRALCCEFAIIQGPPGTGKTFLGLKVIRALLANSEVVAKNAAGPILVICYTNHALDQFLEGIMAFEENIVRIGGRSKSEKLKERNLNALLGETDQAVAFAQHKRERKKLVERLRELEGEIAACVGQLKKLVLAQEDVLALAFSEAQARSLYANHTLEQVGNVVANWLGLPSGSNVSKLSEVLSSPKPKIEAKSIPQNSQNKYIPPRKNNSNKLKSEPLSALEEEELILYTQMERKIDDDENQPKKETFQLDDVIISFDDIDVLLDSTIEAYDVWELPHPERVKLYKFWLKRFRENQHRDLAGLCKLYDNGCKARIDIENEMKISVLSEAKVIGMTTTGAAKFNKVIQKVRAPIVVVEEAAEVLESHIITALSAATKHLILIGDHEQLRPKTAVYELTKHFHMDVSLFERMVKNGVEHSTLLRQRRMRPEISRIMSVIYPALVNHPFVESYPHVLGMKKDLFFLNHQVLENHNTHSLSKMNSHEAAILGELCKYLLLQGYSAERITVLTSYSGQVKLLRNELNRIEETSWKEYMMDRPAEEQTHINKVYVTSVDNYQGEENDIILLSLVRSNRNGIIGFLNISNRICVALSRARHGMYIVGNGTMLKERNECWRDVISLLEQANQFGTNLALRCKNHQTDTLVHHVNDFKGVRDGGCHVLCGFLLPCGHQCTYRCHPFSHEHVLCKSKMSTVRPCGHILENHFCYEEIGDCDVEVSKPLACGHEMMMPCSIEPDASKVCTHPCPRPLPCGHQCTQFCGEKCNRKCKEMTMKTLVCGHEVNVECHFNAVNIVCQVCQSQ